MTSRIIVEHRVLTGVSEINEPIYTWQTFKEMWAEAYDVRSDEVWSEESSQRLAETTTRFRLHYHDAAGIDPTMRIKHDNRVFDIKGIVVDRVRRMQVTIDAVMQSAGLQGAGLDVFVPPIPTGTVGEVFQLLLTIVGGTAPFCVELAGASPPYVLPPGLSLVQATENAWSIEGFPESAGSWPVSIIVTDAASASVTVPLFTITIEAAS